MRIGRKIIRLESVDSTNNYTANLLKAGELSNGTVILADEQFAGRGQRGSEWLVKPGENLTFTYYLDNVNLSVQNQFYLNCYISITLVDLLKRIGLSAKIKWPNDIYIGEKKIAGILIENQLAGEIIKSSIIGIGINVNQLEFDELNATSVKSELNVHFDLMDVLLRFIDQFNKDSSPFGKFEALKESYLGSLFRFSESHQYEDEEGVFIGEIIDVLNSGQLVICRSDETIKNYSLKEVKFIL